MRTKIIATILFLISLSMFATTVTAQEAISYSTLNTDADALPFALAFDENTTKLYVTEYWYKGFYEIDLSTRQVTQHLFAWGGTPWDDLGIRAYDCVVVNGKLYVSGRQGDIGVYDGSYYTIDVYGGREGIIYSNGYLWVAGYNLAKINVTSDTVVETYDLGCWSNLMAEDGIYLWISSTATGKLLKFNTQTGTVEKEYSGFNRPLGVVADALYVYVAENEEAPRSIGEEKTGKIARLTKATEEIVRFDTGIPITRQGPYYLTFDSLGHLWFTDNSGHVGILGSVTFNSTYTYQYWIREYAGKMWFACKGSAHLGTIETLSQTVGGEVHQIDRVGLLISNLYGLAWYSWIPILALSSVFAIYFLIKKR